MDFIVSCAKFKENVSKTFCRIEEILLIQLKYIRRIKIDDR